MINFSEKTAAVEALLNQNLSGYQIGRNVERNDDPNVAAAGRGWIGIYRGRVNYTPEGGMGPAPWMGHMEIVVEVQTASMQSGEDAEDKLEAAVKEIMDVLTSNKKLDNTVDMTNGYGIEYEYNAGERIWHHSAAITIRAEVRTG